MKKFLFYFLSCTWGIIMTLIGAIATFFLYVGGCRVKRHGHCFYTEVGEHWGGVELGMFFLCQKDAPYITKNHEHGHALQNCIWGPLFPFVIAIPSAIRYHYRNWRTKRGLPPNTKYDDIWFEGQATKWGTKFINNL